MAIEILAKGPADVCQRHIVDRGAGHARLDPFEVGQIVEAGLEDTVRRNCLVEAGFRWKRRQTTAADPGRDTTNQLSRQAGQAADYLGGTRREY